MILRYAGNFPRKVSVYLHGRWNFVDYAYNLKKTVTVLQPAHYLNSTNMKHIPGTNIQWRIKYYNFNTMTFPKLNDVPYKMPCLSFCSPL